MKLRGNLFVRIVVALTAVGLIPIAFLSYKLVDLNKDALLTQVLAAHSLAARTAAERIESDSRSWSATCGALAANPTLNSDPSSDAAKQLLADTLESQPSAAGIAVVTFNGELLVRVQRKNKGELVSAALAASDRTVAQQFVTAGGTPWLVVSVPTQEGYRYVRMVSDASSLRETLNPEELGGDARMLLVDAAGKALLGEGAVAEFPRAVLDGVASGRARGATRMPDSKGNLVVGAWARVPGTGWHVISRQPATVAQAIVLDNRRRSIGAILAALALIVMISSAAWIGIVRPIRQLMLAQEAFEAVPVDEASGEIDQIRKSIAILERRVADKKKFDDVFLGRYRVLDVLGEGGMGTVFRGWDPRLLREVALKTIRLRETFETREESQQAVQSLVNEAIVIAKLSHPNIVQVFDVEASENAAFVAMELVSGGTLANVLSKQAKIPVAQAVPLFASIAAGLAAGHEQGVVHYDVKPANVLLGVTGSVKVTDFGVAGLLSTSGHQKDVIFGTPGYLPPEAIVGRGYGPAGDFFSLGVMMYRALTGEMPFKGANVKSLLMATVREVPPALPAGLAGWSKELDALLWAMLAKEPGEREAGCRDIAKKLSAAAAARGWTWAKPDISGAAAPRLSQKGVFVQTMQSGTIRDAADVPR